MVALVSTGGRCSVGCGGGTDTVYADKTDDVGGDCERVRVR